MSDQELSLVNKVELRIALAESDKQFENALNVYLAPVLLKLASPHAEVRQAVLKIIQHVIPRITAARTIKLPVEALIQQVKTPNVNGDSSSVRLYSTLFISRGVDRLNEDEKKSLVPLVIEGLHTYPRNISARMFNILCKLLQNWKTPMRGTSEYDGMRDFLQFDKNPKDEKYVALLISKFLLLIPEATNKATPGLNLQDNTFFNTDAGVNYKTRDEIFKVKQSLLEFLKGGFSAEQSTLPWLIASADPSSSINESSEIIFKKLGVEYDDIKVFGDVPLVSHITNLFLGEGAPPVDSNLQCKLLQVLMKSHHLTSQDKIATVALNSDNARLRSLAIQFIRKLGQSPPVEDQDLEKFNEDIAHQLRNSILAEGWPEIQIASGSNYSSKLNDVQAKYEALGEILKSFPNIFYNDWSFLEFLFDSLAGNSQTPELIPSIQNALSGLTVHLGNLSEERKVSLKSLTRKYIANDAARYIAVKFSNSAFPFEDSEARMLSVLGTTKTNAPHTIEESSNGLHPYWFNINQASNTTDFKSTTYLLGQESTVVFPSFDDFVTTLINEVESSKVNPASSAVFASLPKAIEFAEQVLVMEATKDKNTVIIPDQDWSVRLEKAIEMNDTVRDFVIAKSKESELQEPLFKLMALCIDAIVGQFVNSTGIVVDTTYALILTRLISFASSPAVASLIPKISDLLNLIDSQTLDDLSLSRICKVIGIVASHPNNPDEDVGKLLVTLTSNLNYQKSKARVLAVSYLISRLTLRDRLNVITDQLLTTVLQSLQDMLQDSSFYYLALDAVSQLAMFGVLGPVINPQFVSFTDKFKEIIRSRVKKIDERSVLALGYLTLTSDKQEGDSLTDDEQIIYNTYISKQVEYVFTSGEALVLDAAGWDSKLLSKQLDIPGETIKYVPSNLSRVTTLLNTVLAACRHTQPALRKAGCIWLLSFVQYCKHLPQVRSKASELHVTFMRFLADRDELVQESASRGLGLVFEMGDVELKDTLVKSLLKSFTQSNTTSFTSGTVEHDTELFEPDLLRTNEGSVSTYKDVLNLAQDVGDPSLVYKFMSLAKSSSLWSSRKGIAFGLESILAQSSLDKLLSTNQQLSDRLIPKLFRYRYDPNLGVSKSMNDIWNALIKDTSKAVDANFDKILKEVLNSMGKKEWRTRQGSTAALNDLLQMVELVKYQNKLEEIWTMSFRAMDDIKESVRKEGTSLTKSLATKFTRLLEKSTGETSSKTSSILEFLIPFLLGNKGLLSDSQEVKDFALDTLLKLCKSGNKNMKIYVPELIENFINLFSSLEPEVVNYLVLNASKYNVDHNEIDAKRMKSVGHSPLMDAIEKLLLQLDDNNLPDFMTRLEKSIKKGVGLPTKVSAAMVVMNMVTHHLQMIRPYGDRLLLITMNQINDRNDTIASSYAAACGHLCRIAKVETVIKLSKKINQMYFEPAEAGDERSRILASLASENVSKYSGDKFEMVASAFLPVAYIGKFDSSKQVVANFDREWIENTSGGNSSIKLYLSEIIDLVKKYLKSNEFAIRKTLAKALSNLCLAIDNLNQFSTAIIDEILQLLIESNKGKSWDGKELVFDSLVSFSIMAKSYIIHHEDILETINKTVTVEIKRKNKTYQKKAILSCGKYIHDFHEDDDLVELYIEIMGNVLGDRYDNTDDDSDEEMDDNNKKLNTKENIELEEKKLKVLDNLATAFYTSPDINTELFKFIFNQLVKIFQSTVLENTWRSRLSTTEVFKKVLTAIEESGQPVDTQVLLKTWSFLKDKSLQHDTIENVKIQFIRLSKQLNEYLHGEPTINEGLEQFSKHENSNVVLTELRKTS